MNLLPPLVEGGGGKTPWPARGPLEAVLSEQLAGPRLPLSKGGASLGRVLRGSRRKAAAVKWGRKSASLGIRVSLSGHLLPGRPWARLQLLCAPASELRHRLEGTLAWGLGVSLLAGLCL